LKYYKLSDQSIFFIFYFFKHSVLKVPEEKLVFLACCSYQLLNVILLENKYYLIDKEEKIKQTFVQWEIFSWLEKEIIVVVATLVTWQIKYFDNW